MDSAAGRTTGVGLALSGDGGTDGAAFENFDRVCARFYNSCSSFSSSAFASMSIGMEMTAGS